MNFMGKLLGMEGKVLGMMGKLLGMMCKPPNCPPWNICPSVINVC